MLRLKDLAEELVDRLLEDPEAGQTDWLVQSLLGLCDDASVALSDEEVEHNIAGRISDSLMLLAHDEALGAVYYMYGYLRGFNRSAMPERNMMLRTDDWMRYWVNSQFSLSDEPS